MERLTLHNLTSAFDYKAHNLTKEEVAEVYKRLADIEDKIESGQLVDTTPYIIEIKNEIPFRFKVIKPTIHRRNVEMCSSRESAEERIKKLQEAKL